MITASFLVPPGLCNSQARLRQWDSLGDPSPSSRPSRCRRSLRHTTRAPLLGASVPPQDDHESFASPFSFRPLETQHEDLEQDFDVSPARVEERAGQTAPRSRTPSERKDAIPFVGYCPRASGLGLRTGTADAVRAGNLTSRILSQRAGQSRTGRSSRQSTPGRVRERRCKGARWDDPFRSSRCPDRGKGFTSFRARSARVDYRVRCVRRSFQRGASSSKYRHWDV